MKGITDTGFQFSIDENALNDLELLDAIAEVDEDALNISRIIVKLLGKEQRKAFYAHLKKVHGTDRVPAEAVAAEIANMFDSLGETGKN